MIACLDNHVLLWGVREVAEPGQEHMILRAKQFFMDAEEQKVRLVIPSVVLGELLSGIEEQHHNLVKNLSLRGFPIPPYDAAAAQAFARLWRQRKADGTTTALRQSGATKQELKADCMIVATALAQRCTVIYSHDGKLKTFAGSEIEVRELPDLPPQQQLLPWVAAQAGNSAPSQP